MAAPCAEHSACWAEARAGAEARALWLIGGSLKPVRCCGGALRFSGLLAPRGAWSPRGPGSGNAALRVAGATCDPRGVGNDTCDPPERAATSILKPVRSQ